MDSTNSNRKRAREESAESPPNQPESKLIRVDSSSSINSDANSGESSTNNRVNSEDLDVDSAEAKMIQQDLLNILDDTDEPPIQGLDSVIKSFEEEIQVPAPPAFETSSCGGSGDSSPSSQPELGYLLEASDDELGLPPTTNNVGATEEKKMETADFTETAFDGVLGCFDNDMIPSYDAFEFGGFGEYEESYVNNGGVGEYVALGGLFDYAVDGGGVSWRTESLSAL